MKKVTLQMLLMILLVSCSDDVLIVNNDQLKLITLDANEPRVVQNRLAFDSKDQLRRFVDNSKSNDFETAKAAIRRFEEYGFAPLLPTFEPHELEKVAAFVNKVSNNQAKLMADSVDIDDDDPLVSDSYFAIILNEEREVIVSDSIYRFTEFGLLYTSSDNYAAIDKYMDSLQNCMLTIQKGAGYLGDGVYSFVPDDVLNICGDEGGEGGRMIGTMESRIESLTKDEFMGQMKVCDYQGNVLNKIFGPSEKCIDQWSSSRRIKTKTWNQNYFLYASIGLLTKTQKRSLGIWWASDANELELGYDIVKYRYDGVDASRLLGQINANAKGLNYYYEYDGYLINQYGIIHPSNNYGADANLFDHWPIADSDSRVLKIYLGGPIQDFVDKIDADLLTIDGKELNQQVKALTKQAWSAVTKYLKTASTKGGVVIVGGDPNYNKAYFVYTNWHRNHTNDNKITDVLDFNTATIGFKTNVSSGSTSPTYSSPKSYKEFAISCYGVGRRDSEWRGGRIILVQK